MTLFEEFEWRGHGVGRRPRACAMRSRTSASPRTSVSIRPRRACTSASLLTVMGAGAPAALRPHADRDRRRRHRDDRRSERQDRRSATLLSTEQIDAQRRAACARSSSASSISTRRRTPRGSSTTPTGSAPSICSTFLRDVGKHFTVNYMLQKESVSRRHRERRRHLLHRVQLPDAAGVRLPAAVRSPTAARCRWAAAINGATSPRASS